VKNKNKEKFGIVKSDVIQDPNLSTTSKTVYALLCTFADKHRECYPSVIHISELLSIDRRTVQRAITELKDKKYVKKEKRLFKIK
jgi:Mn-dependent DtxR family transcriptional regulator